MNLCCHIQVAAMCHTMSMRRITQLPVMWSKKHTNNVTQSKKHLEASDLSFFFSFFLLILARSNFDHYARECNFGILKKKQKQNKNKTKKQKNLSAVFLTK